jgi:hypothetical protein
MLEFRAGKMVFDGKKVVPDLRKGLVRVGRVNCTLFFVLHIVRAYVKIFICLVQDIMFF